MRKNTYHPKWRRIPRLLPSLQLLSLFLLHQTTLAQGAGLRGGSSELWRTALVDGSESALFRPSAPTIGDNENDITSNALICPYDDLVAYRHCPSTAHNRTTPVCQYNEATHEYTTVCSKTHTLMTPQESAVLPRAHPKSHCGVCHRCFEDREELAAAIDLYKSYTQVHVDLANTYGWPIGHWCVDKVTSFSNLFFGKSKFNEDISRWQTRQVTDMTAMFQNAYAFNQPLDGWDTSQVTAMTRMFAMAIHFDQDISSWDVSNVHDMGYMFLHALEFNQDISRWQVHNARNLNSMFFGATNFEKHHLKEWQISEHADTENMCQWDENHHHHDDHDEKEQPQQSS